MPNDDVTIGSYRDDRLTRARGNELIISRCPHQVSALTVDYFGCLNPTSSTASMFPGIFFTLRSSSLVSACLSNDCQPSSSLSSELNDNIISTSKILHMHVSIDREKYQRPYLTLCSSNWLNTPTSGMNWSTMTILLFGPMAAAR